MEYQILFTEEFDNIVLGLIGSEISKEEFLMTLNKDDLKQLKVEVVDYWRENNFTYSDLAPLMFALEFIKTSNITTTRKFLEACKIRVPHKIEKKGKKHVQDFFLKHYHKEHVREEVIIMSKHFLTEAIAMVEATKEATEKDKEAVFEIVANILGSEIGILNLVWISEKITFTQELTEFLHRNHEWDIFFCEILSADRAEKLDYVQLLIKPENKNLHPDLEIAHLKKLLKNKEKEINKANKRSQDLNRELLKQKKIIKQLKGENYELVEINDTEQNAFNKEFFDSQEVYINVINTLSSDLESLQTRFDDLSAKNINDKQSLDLDGKKIAILGGNRERFYRETIESKNGEIIFVAEDDFNKIAGAIAKCDAVFYLKDVLSHAFFKEAYPLCKEYNVPFIYLNSLGISTFKNKLNELIEQGNF